MLKQKLYALAELLAFLVAILLLGGMFFVWFLWMLTTTKP
jgi:uncharacterized membrane protein